MDNNVRTRDKVISIVLIFVAVIFMISASLFIPTTIHSYYYLNIYLLNIPKESGLSAIEITQAYNDVLRSVWFDVPFKAGSLPFTEETAAHFKDCGPLFWASLISFISTTFLLIIYFILVKKKIFNIVRFKKFSAFSYAGAFLMTLILVFGIWGLIDFDSLFEVFHKVLFPGKTNYVIDPETDPVINIFPISFFIVTAGFIVLQIATFSLTSIIIDVKKIREHKKSKQ